MKEEEEERNAFFVYSLLVALVVVAVRGMFNCMNTQSTAVDYHAFKAMRLRILLRSFRRYAKRKSNSCVVFHGIFFVVVSLSSGSLTRTTHTHTTTFAVGCVCVSVPCFVASSFAVLQLLYTFRLHNYVSSCVGLRFRRLQEPQQHSRLINVNRVIKRNCCRKLCFFFLSRVEKHVQIVTKCLLLLLWLLLIRSSIGEKSHRITHSFVFALFSLLGYFGEMEINKNRLVNTRKNRRRRHCLRIEMVFD